MSLMFLLEFKYTPSIFSHNLPTPYGWKIFYVYFVMYCRFEFFVDMNNVDRFTCCYNIRASALLKCVASPSTSSGILGYVSNAMVFTFLNTKFTKDLPWEFFRNLCLFKTTVLYWHGLTVEEWTIKNFAEGKKSNSFWNFFESYLFKLIAWVKIGSIP